MQITRFSPLWPVLDAQYPNRLGRLCEHMLEARFQRDEHRSLFGHGMPPVDVIEERDTIRLVAELPGVKPEDVRISLEGNVLTLQGEKKEEERQDDRLYRCERTYGLFERAFTLPATIDANTIVAKFESGLLTVLLPKVKAAKPRRSRSPSNSRHRWSGGMGGRGNPAARRSHLEHRSAVPRSSSGRTRPHLAPAWVPWTRSRDAIHHSPLHAGGPHAGLCRPAVAGVVRPATTVSEASTRWIPCPECKKP